MGFIGGAGGAEPDNESLELDANGKLSIKDLGVLTEHLELKAVGSSQLKSSSVKTQQILDSTIQTIDLNPNIFEPLNQLSSEHELEIIELQANTSLTPFDHDGLISDSFPDADGYNGYVNTGNTTAEYDTVNLKYGAGNIVTEQETLDFSVDQEGFSLGGGWTYNSGIRIQNTGSTSDAQATRTLTFNLDQDDSIWEGDLFYQEAGSPGIRSTIYLRNGGTNVATIQFDGVSASVNTQFDLRINGTIVGSPYNHAQFYTVKVVFNFTAETFEVFMDDVSVGTFSFQNTATQVTNVIIEHKDGGGTGAGFTYFDNMFTENVTATSGDGVIECDLPSITGTVIQTQLVCRTPDRETGDTVDYELEDASANTDENQPLDTQNDIVNLTGNPVKLRINLTQKATDPSPQVPSCASWALKVWKS